MAIRTLLAANRGEIVSRIASTARRLGISTVGVYADSDAGGAYLRDVDVAVRLGDDRTSTPYLDVEVIIAAARRSGADAVHPGYGFLAENADFALACAQAGLVWVGPPPSAMRAMGLKIEAKERARAAGVPVLESVEVGDDVEAAINAAAPLGFPLLVKPSAGGGGKGMRRVDAGADLREAIMTSRREAIAAFGDGTLFVERYIESPRHIEVQIVGDAHGNLVHVGERDCSLQRRHQKIVEEAPAPGLSDALRRRLWDAALALGRAIDYSSAGTVEFLVFGEEFAFLEMNTRLQVEHAVTEEICGLDLVELQLRVAAGEHLPITQEQVRFGGHAVEVRLYAEDPTRDFLPSPGTVLRMDAPALAGVRWELGITSGDVVSSRYDPMIAKVIGSAADRDGAIALVDRALAELRIHGIRTNRDFLLGILRSREFRRAETTTDLLERQPKLLSVVRDPDLTRFHGVAAVIASATARDVNMPWHGLAPIGWRNLKSQDSTAEFTLEGTPYSLSYRLERDGTWTITHDGENACARTFATENGWLDIEVDGLRRRCLVCDYGDIVVVDTTGSQSEFGRSDSAAADAEEGVAAAAVAPMPGTVIEVSVSVGQEVGPGDVLAIISAMKMEHRVTAAGHGIVRAVLVSGGQAVDTHQLLVELEEAG